MKNNYILLPEILGYKLHITLKRKRIVYQKDDVKFEIDSYTKPNKYYVVGIEGNKDKVDKIYNEIM